MHRILLQFKLSSLEANEINAEQTQSLKSKSDQSLVFVPMEYESGSGYSYACVITLGRINAIRKESEYHGIKGCLAALCVMQE